MNNKHGQHLHTALDFLDEEAKDSYYRQVSSALELHRPAFNYDRNDFSFPGVAPIDATVPKVVPKSLQSRLL